MTASADFGGGRGFVAARALGADGIDVDVRWIARALKSMPPRGSHEGKRRANINPGRE
jgi:NAD(P)H-hydrate repair Nnr-like enzyme with NAD(P)H-hydrate epimerase domain